MRKGLVICFTFLICVLLCSCFNPYYDSDNDTIDTSALALDALDNAFPEIVEQLSEEQLLEILHRINPDVDFENSRKLVTDKLIDSIDITSLLAELEETFDIEIDMEYVTPENLDSVEAMWNMIQELME